MLRTSVKHRNCSVTSWNFSNFSRVRKGQLIVGRSRLAAIDHCVPEYYFNLATYGNKRYNISKCKTSESLFVSDSNFVISSGTFGDGLIISGHDVIWMKKKSRTCAYCALVRNTTSCGKAKKSYYKCRTCDVYLCSKGCDPDAMTIALAMRREAAEMNRIYKENGWHCVVRNEGNKYKLCTLCQTNKAKTKSGRFHSSTSSSLSTGYSNTSNQAREHKLVLCAKQRICSYCRMKRVKTKSGWYRYTLYACEACGVSLCKRNPTCFIEYHKERGIPIEGHHNWF
ncbi:hypothetical protein FSP39_024855 [Pinctada imbricata]|uniref:PiggyBac transposable element-derived protein 4 C-terminal zinc-ribbon domain-containing protein n=1 Tax=Pinctada imbricata TaxID=66713 RepID=A0AA88YST1_PINIB|nr:hypothetical protein FSP39_024855 [Pinctada imbricata]